MYKVNVTIAIGIIILILIVNIIMHGITVGAINSADEFDVENKQVLDMIAKEQLGILITEAILFVLLVVVLIIYFTSSTTNSFVNLLSEKIRTILFVILLFLLISGIMSISQTVRVQCKTSQTEKTVYNLSLWSGVITLIGFTFAALFSGHPMKFFTG